MNPAIAQVVVALPVEGPFDYAIPSDLRGRIKPGHRVKILFNRQVRVGTVVGFIKKSAFKRLNAIIDILDNLPALNDKQLKMAKQMSLYLGCSSGEAMEAFLPAQLKKKKGSDDILESKKFPAEKKNPQYQLCHVLNYEAFFKDLKGILNEQMDAAQQVLVLVPEASQIPWVKRKLEELTSRRLAVWDKNVTAKQEYAQWNQMKAGNISLVLGTRSAIFAPLSNLSHIFIFDEEHASYKQEQSPHYHIREMALLRSKVESCDVTFISSVPSVNIWQKAKSKAWKKRDYLDAPLAPLQVVDMSNYNPGKMSIISIPLRNHIERALQDNKQIILFMNKRGFGRVTRCQQCGFVLKCERCDTNMIYQHAKNNMACRHCKSTCEIPEVCPSCNNAYLRSMGQGTEKLEQAVRRQFPGVNVGCFDQDQKQFPVRARIIICTSAIFQLRRLARFGLFAIIDFDAELYHMDFRSSERALHLLITARLMAEDQAIVQTSLRDNYCIKPAVAGDFGSFYRKELKLRNELGFPPFKRIVKILIRGEKEENVVGQSQRIFSEINKKETGQIEIMEPHPDVIPKLRDQYRVVIYLKGKDVKNILSLVKDVQKKIRTGKNIVTVDVD